MNDVSLNDIVSPDKFEKDNPTLFEGKGTPNLSYLVRTRHLNGLAEAGAVIEPAQRRLMIVVPRFLEWMLSRKVAA